MKYLTIFIIYVLDTFVHQRNLFKSLKKLNLDIKFIFDIGAHSGQYTLHFYKLFPNAKIIAFEPNKVLYNFLLKKFAHNNNIEVYEKAISSQNQKLNMIIDKEITKNSSAAKVNYDSKTFKLKKLLYQSSKEKDLKNLTTVDAVSLKNFIEQKKIIPDIVKIDVEGLEYDVLLGLENKLKECQCIILEFHFDNVYENHDTTQLNELLELNDFTLAAAIKFPFMEWEDRIYIKDK